MRRIGFCAFFVLAVLPTAGRLAADVSVLEHKAAAKRLKPHGHPGPRAAGDLSLVDSGGLRYFIDTNTTASSPTTASGAMSDATFTAAVPSTTSAGGVFNQPLSDAFDGYNILCVSLSGAMGPCSSKDPAFAIYSPGAVPTPECNSRQYVFAPQTIGGLTVSRKVFVPMNDQFARWLNIFTNTTGAPITFSMVTANNLGSDNQTLIVSSSNGNSTAEPTDTWVSTFQNYGNCTSLPPGVSCDPRLGHVLQGAGAPVPLSGIHFADGDELPWWSYSITLAPGETKIIANFVTGQPSKAAANAKAAELAGLPPHAVQCLAGTERQQIANFAAAPNVVEIPTLGEIGLAILAVALTAAGLLVLRRRSAAA
jgi:hypothetical protein